MYSRWLGVLNPSPSCSASKIGQEWFLSLYTCPPLHIVIFPHMCEHGANMFTNYVCNMSTSGNTVYKPVCCRNSWVYRQRLPCIYNEMLALYLGASMLCGFLQCTSASLIHCNHNCRAMPPLALSFLHCYIIHGICNIFVLCPCYGPYFYCSMICSLE